MTDRSIPPVFQALHWYRLRAVLRNTTLTNHTTTHPSIVMEAIVKSVSSSVISNHSSAPTVIHHILADTPLRTITLHTEITIEVLFFGTDRAYAETWREALHLYLSDPDLRTNFTLVEAGMVEERTYHALAAEHRALPSHTEICLLFCSPLPFKRTEGKPRTYLNKEDFIQTLSNRFTQLFGKVFVYSSTEDDFEMLPYFWHYTEIKHRSHSQPGATQFVNGCAGPLYIKGQFADLLPFLILGSELHAGTKLSNSQGFFRIDTRAHGFFDDTFPDERELLAVVEETLDEYDDAAKELTGKDGFDFDATQYARELAEKVRSGTYAFSPNQAFTSLGEKKRLVETLNLSDLVINRYLARTIGTVLDRMFEESSIGFRRGVSRQDAVRMVREAFEEGYRYVIKSDIDDYFPSIDHTILKRQLDRCLPDGDRQIRTLTEKSIDTGFILGGSLVPRAKGLSQGSPLSPLLANLYLDSFDEAIQNAGVKLIRYADDFLLFTRSSEETEEVFKKIQDVLSEIGLKIKEGKTAIVPIEEEFYFLGIRWRGKEAELEPEDIFEKALKKPLYIMEESVFLSARGDTIEVRKYGKLLETLPLRRISEIIVMNRSVVSSLLLRKCSQQNIPLSLALQSGYYIATLKPDSKQYHLLSHHHASTFCALGETEVLSLAKEFAARKIENFATLFRTKYERDGFLLIHDLEASIQKIREAVSVDQVRGIEGAASKKIYQQMNRLILDPAFHIKKRLKRNPDRINSLLNFGYYLLFTHINASLRAMGLNPYLGFLHSSADAYESLVCDLQEPFRARIVRLVIRCINLGVISQDDFKETGRGLRLTYEGVKKFIGQFETEMNRRHGKGDISLRENIHVQVGIVKKWAMGEGSLTVYRWKAD